MQAYGVLYLRLEVLYLRLEMPPPQGIRMGSGTSREAVEKTHRWQGPAPSVTIPR
jgi:hypothetical protein